LLSLACGSSTEPKVVLGSIDKYTITCTLLISDKIAAFLSDLIGLIDQVLEFAHIKGSA
jgi:hypothetical protein